MSVPPALAGGEITTIIIVTLLRTPRPPLSAQIAIPLKSVPVLCITYSPCSRAALRIFSGARPYVIDRNRRDNQRDRRGNPAFDTVSGSRQPRRPPADLLQQGCRYQIGYPANLDSEDRALHPVPH